MAQDFIISCLIYFLLFIYQSPNPTSASFQDGLKKEKIYLNQCKNCDHSKTNIDSVFTKDSNYLRSLYKAFHKYPSHPYNLLLRGWGARGMPFNVLYTPNAHQQKIMKSVPHRETFTKEPAMPEIYDLVLEDEKPMSKTSETTLKKHLIPRKHYSLIPQLFVSYGW